VPDAGSLAPHHPQHLQVPVPAKIAAVCSKNPPPSGSTVVFQQKGEISAKHKILVLPVVAKRITSASKKHNRFQQKMMRRRRQLQQKQSPDPAKFLPVVAKSNVRAAKMT